MSFTIRTPFNDTPKTYISPHTSKIKQKAGLQGHIIHRNIFSVKYIDNVTHCIRHCLHTFTNKFPIPIIFYIFFVIHITSILLSMIFPLSFT